jgi:alpha-glutamyl/putrescinyl thymine pyrophosphorylase clade 1
VSFVGTRARPRPGPGFDVYWRFAAERQKVYRRRLDGVVGAELTSDAVLEQFRFTNAYRASDRVSQYLITDVIYDRSREWVDTFARVLVFKVFNRIDTWECLQSTVTDVDADALLAGALDAALERRATHGPLYNAAYIMPPPRNRTGAKFRRHLDLLRQMIREGAHERIASAHSMTNAFDVLAAYDSIGPFLAYQFLIDLNYTCHLSFSEDEYVVAGPGALRGIRKCFTDQGDYRPSDIIRWVADQQVDAFERRALEWNDLWGRPLQLIDAQNLFCEVDKYTRQARPDLSKYAPGSRIKQRYKPAARPLTAWFPPKWGVNDAVPTAYRRR